MSRIIGVSTEKQYEEALESIEVLLQKGQKMSDSEKQELRRLSVLVECYEQKTYPMPPNNFIKN